MSYKKFRPNDIVHSTIVAHPDLNFFVNSGSLYINRESSEVGGYSNNVKHINQGEISLDELNINRPADSLVYRFIEKSSTRYAFRTISTSQFDDTSQFAFGSVITQSLPMSASVTRIYVPDGPEFGTYNFETINSPADNKKYITALKNILTSQQALNPTSNFTSIGTQKVNMVCIPGIFYGSEVKRGTVELNYYVTGALAAQAKDKNSNGQLIQTSGANAGHIVGHVIYNQGIILLTGSWDLHNSYQDHYFSTTAKEAPSWLSFGTGLTEIGTAVANGHVVSSSYEIKCKGTNKVPTLTLLAHAEKNELNYSHNPTFIDYYQTGNVSLNINSYSEQESKIKSINKSIFAGHTEEFENITYISKIGIYDKDKNLIGIATLANPVKKTEIKDYMFKLRMDF